MNIKFEKIFGSGLQIAIWATAIGLISIYIEFNIHFLPEIQIPYHKIFSIICLLFWLILFIYSFISLPNKQKGNILITNGVYTYIRHPLYATFLVFFYLSLVFYFQSYLVFIAQIFSIIIAGKIVNKEEIFMRNLFGKEYVEYSQKTRKFIPYVF